MGANAVKSIVLMMVLVVLSFLVGSQVSDGLKDSAGAFLTIASVVAGFGMLLLGRRSWALIYILPAVMLNCYFLPDYAFTQTNYPAGFAFCALLLVYWGLMSMMNFVSFRWRGLLVADVLVSVVVICFVVSFIRYPVAIAFFADDAEYVGGKEYLWCAMMVLYYLAISSMSGDPDEVILNIKRAFFAFCIAQLLYFLCQIGNGSLRSAVGSMHDRDVRFPAFRVIGPVLVYYAYTSAPIMAVFSRLKSLAALCVGGMTTIMIGSREIFASVALAVLVVSFVKREIVFFAICCICLYASILGLSATKALEAFPTSIQRTLFVLPGVEVRSDVARGTSGSSESRIQIWKLGMDPRTGIIRDYIWGDGFRASTAQIQRARVEGMRGARNVRSETDRAWLMANGGNWHNGWLMTVNRIGLVGLVVVNVVFLYGLYLFIKVAMAFRRHRDFPYIMAMVMSYAGTVLTFPWGTQTLVNFFASFQTFGLLKILYCVASEKGMLRPLFIQERYVPLAIRDMESAEL